jgi:UDP-glucose 4-epimerase
LKVLITGGLGNLGLWVTEFLLQQNLQIDVLGRSEKIAIIHPNYTFIEADITDFSRLREKIPCFYDCCIHLASYNEYFHANYEETALKVNVQGTENICRALGVKGVGKIVYLSTFHVYGCSSGEINEKTGINPNNNYALTHFFAEKLVELYSRKYKSDYCIFRLTNSYGCPKTPTTDKWYLILNDLCRQAYNTAVIKLDSNGNALRDYIWMGDVAAIIHKSLSSSDLNNDFFNLSANNILSVKNVVKIVQSAFEDKFDVKPRTLFNETDQRELSFLKVSNDKLLSRISWEFENRIYQEAHNIFLLLEKGNILR